MFYVSAKHKDSYIVVDTSDMVADVFSRSDILAAVKHGIRIMGVRGSRVLPVNLNSMTKEEFIRDFVAGMDRVLGVDNASTDENISFDDSAIILKVRYKYGELWNSRGNLLSSYYNLLEDYVTGFDKEHNTWIMFKAKSGFIEFIFS